MIRIPIPKERLSDFCRKWQITELALFGSVLREDFRPESDVDVWVRFHPNARHTFFDLFHMEQELREILGRKVDLITRRSIEASDNRFRRNAILNSAEVVYGA